MQSIVDQFHAAIALNDFNLANFRRSNLLLQRFFVL